MDFTLEILPISSSDIDAAYSLETEGYPANEAASLESLNYRYQNAPHLFIGAFDTQNNKRQLVGFVVGTASRSKVVNERSMKVHDSYGDTACIHSVCVDLTHRRKGIALKLLKSFIEIVLNCPISEYQKVKLTRISLICKKDLINFYEKAGFKLIGSSEVVHGENHWFDMSLEIGES